MAATPQNSNPLYCRWPGDHVSAALEGRESAFELHANDGMPLGAVACGAASTATTNWRTPCWVSSI